MKVIIVIVAQTDKIGCGFDKLASLYNIYYSNRNLYSLFSMFSKFIMLNVKLKGAQLRTKQWNSYFLIFKKENKNKNH